MKAEILKVQIDKYYSYDEALGAMEEQGVKHLGWLNGGIKVPEGDYERVYMNWSGSSTLYVDAVKRIAYSVDMGD